ncbi:MAG: serine hydrolase [Acidobacteriota bacterium]
MDRLPRGARIVTLCLGAAVLAAAAAHAAGEGERIDAMVASYAAKGQFSGAVLVARNGEVVLEKAYGLANREWGIANTPDTRFRIASVTKQFTAMLVMQLVEEGKLATETTLAEALPWYRKDTGARVTIHHLLNHTSGIPSYTDRPDFRAAHERKAYSLKDLVTTLCSGDLQWEPGSKFRYNNSGYVILGAVIEQVAGKPYETVLRERILDPLGMTGTGYDHTETILPRRAAGYQLDLRTVVNGPFLDMSVPHAAGAMYSTVGDLYRWDRALYGTKLLSEQGKARMFTPGLGEYGYGWNIVKAQVGPDKAERTLIRHAGGIRGFSSLIVRVPADGHVAVVLSNLAGSRTTAVAMGALDVLYGRTPPAPKESVADAVGATLEAKGIEAALARFRELRAGDQTAYEFHERELNLLGYELIARGRIDEAIAIFALNVEIYPDSGNVYDSLAEAYATKGDKDLAVKNYARSLERDPGNANAVERLAELMKKK